MRGFRFRSSLKKSSAEDVSACSRRSSSSQARKKYLVPRVNGLRFINLDVLLQELTWRVWATNASTNILGLALETSRLLANLRYKLR